LVTTYYPLFPLRNCLRKVVDSPAMDDERFQQMEKRLNEQVEATQAMNETLNKF
jgi:hypothetical protein